MKFYTIFTLTCCLYFASASVFQGRNLLRLYSNSLKRYTSQAARPFSRFSAPSPFLRPSNTGGSVLSSQLKSGVQLPSKIAESVRQLSIASASPLSPSYPTIATLKVSQELYKAQGLYKSNSIKHVELDITGIKMPYKTGDQIGIFLQNDPELVELIGSLANVNLDKEFAPSDNLPVNGLWSSRERALPLEISYRDFLTNFVDLTTIPAHELKSLAQYCSDAKESESLIQLASADPSQSVVNLNLVHILENFKSFKPPVDMLCKIMPALWPKYYTIASSSELHPNTIQVAVEEEEYLLEKDRINKGYTPSFSVEGSENLQEKSARVPVFIRESYLRLPVDKPVIMIGDVGTGLAPLRGFLQQRDLLHRSGQAVSETTLYFGARSRESFIYRDEFNDFVKSGSLKMRVSISIDESEAYHVIHLLKSDADYVWDVIKNGGQIVIGERKLSTDFDREVRKVLLDIIVKKGQMYESGAKELLHKMEEQNRLKIVYNEYSLVN